MFSKSDNDIVLKLIDLIKSDSINLYELYNNNDVAKYISYISIIGTIKKIKIEIYINGNIPNFSYLNFYIINKNDEKIIRKIQDTNNFFSLCKIIFKKYAS